VYRLLWASAKQDNRRDWNRLDKPWDQRQDCAGTTTRTHKGIADELGISRPTVDKAIDQLLDHGYITVIGMTDSTYGRPHRIYRVFHPSAIPAQQSILRLFSRPASVRWREWSRGYAVFTEEDGSECMYELTNPEPIDPFEKGQKTTNAT
jgi:DNA-binding transcriptional MocR family regulator